MTELRRSKAESDLRDQALARASSALLHARDLASTIEALSAALKHPESRGLMSQADALRANRAATASALLALQELVDRALDAAGAPPPGLLP
jgi:hypothetical protein